MNETLEKSIDMCAQLIGLLDQDYQTLYMKMSGEIYDDYRMLVLDEIESVTIIKDKLKTLCDAHEYI